MADVDLQDDFIGAKCPWGPALDPGLDHLYSERSRSWRDFARRSLLDTGPPPVPGPSRKFPSKSGLYFVQAHGGEIKIGATTNFKVRLGQLQTASPHPIVLLCFVEGAGTLEREYHALFDGHRLHGEWFSPHQDILAEIERLRQSPIPLRHKEGKP